MFYVKQKLLKYMSNAILAKEISGKMNGLAEGSSYSVFMGYFVYKLLRNIALDTKLSRSLLHVNARLLP